MSDPASEPVVSTEPAQGTRQLLLAAALDALIAVLVVFATSIGIVTAWTVWRSLQLHGQGVTGGREIAAALGQPGILVQILTAIASTSAAALLLYFWRRRAGAAERAASLQALRQPRTWGLALGTGAVVYVATLGSSWLLEQLVGSDPVPTNLAMIEQAWAQWPLFLLLFATVLAPAYEELLFRRVLFGRFLQGGRPLLGLALSSVGFALMHEMPGISANPWPAVAHLLLLYTGMGAAFAWVYWRTGTLWAAIIAHGVNNALALLFHVL